MIKIKKLQKKDFAKFLNLLAAINDKLFEQKTKQKLLKDFNSNLFSVFIVWKDLHMIGCAIVIPSYSTTKAGQTLYLEEIYLKPEHRQKGFGKKLFDYIVAYAKEKNFSRLEWRTANDNTISQKFYSMYNADDQWKYYVLNLI